MKKILLLLLCSTFFFLTIVTPAQAASPVHDSRNVSDYIETLDDGSYFHVVISEDINTSFARSALTKSGSRTVTYHVADGTAVWQFTLNGTFQFTPGVSSSCISGSYSINIYDSSWENTSASSSTSGNQAIGNATFIKKVLFITTQTENVSVALACDSYGNLS